MSSLGEAVLDLTADPTKLDPGLNEGKKKVEGSLGGIKNQLTQFGVFVGTMMGNLVSNALQSIGGAILSSIQNKLKSSLQDFMDYAVQVRETSRSLGVSAEEASRLIQVADDLTISYDALSMSLKLAQRNGIEPSIEGLAKLADEYLALAPGVERTQFLLDKFGKSGMEMGKLLEKGGEGIRQMSDAIDESMILTQEAVDAQREYEIAVDSMNDSWSAFVYQVAPGALDVLNKIINHYRDIITSLKEYGYFYTLFHQLSLDEIAAKREEADAILHVAEANTEATGTYEESSASLTENKTAVKEATKAYDEFKDKLDAISRANQEAERLTRNYAESENSYAKAHAKAIEERKRAQENLNKTIQEGGSSEAVMKAEESLQKASQAIQDLEAEWHKSTQQMIYDMVLAKVSVDGLNDAEFKAMQDLSVEMGLITKEQAEAAKKAIETANAIAAGIQVQEDVMNENKKNTAELKRLEEEKQNAIEGTGDTAVSVSQETTQEVQNATQSQSQSMQSVTGATMSEIDAQRRLQAEVQQTTARYQQLKAMAAGANAAGSSQSGGSGSKSGGDKVGGGSAKKRDSGGMGFAGQTYLIGTGAQPEMFIPEQDGNFLPNTEWMGRMKAAFENIGNIGGASVMAGYRKSMASMSKGGSSAVSRTESRSMQNNINIYNPSPEPASQSVDGTLKKMSYLGVIK